MGIENLKDMDVYLPRLDEHDNMLEVYVTKEEPSGGTLSFELRNEMTQAFQSMFKKDFEELQRKWETKIRTALADVFWTAEMLEEFAKSRS